MARKIKRDAVLKRSAANRQERAAVPSSRAQDREISDDERVEMLRQSYFQSALPDLPKIAGHHTCWLTTTNPRDSVVARERLGYELLKATDHPGWEYAAQKGGQYDGVIMVNEMIGSKIRLDLFERFMRNNHHEEPLREEQKIVYETHQKKNELAQHGAVLIEMPGTVALGQDPGSQSFSETYNEE